jgi:hypothetical protein
MANLSKLDAVNHMLESVGIKPVAALDTGGYTEAADAERVLDRESKLVQCEGHYGNRVMAKSYTAASNVVALASTVLTIKAAGRTQHRNFVLRETGGTPQVWDLDEDTFTIATGTVIQLDVTYEIPYADAQIDLQNVILQRAAQIFQRRFGRNPEADVGHSEERIRAEAVAQRTQGRAASDRSGPAPFALSGPGQQ